MAFTSSGYGGYIADEATWTRLALALGSEYGVEGQNDWKVTPVAISDRTVSVATGAGWGKGVRDKSDAPEQLEIDPAESGFRWDLVVVRRNTAGTGGTTTLAVVEGTSNPLAAFANRKRFEVDITEDDQPLALVRVDAGSSVITDIVDVRVWQANGGATATSTYVLQYLTAPGTQILIGTALWARRMGTDGNATWVRLSGGPRRWTADRLARAVLTSTDNYSGSAWAELCRVTLPADAPAGEYDANIQYVGGAVGAGAMPHDLLVQGPGAYRQIPVHFDGIITTSKNAVVPFTHTGGAATFILSAKAGTGRTAFVANSYTSLDVKWTGA